MTDSVFKRTLMDVHFSTPYLILTIISGDELSLRYNMTQYRIEHDTMGEVKVPANALWGAQTERSRNNFKIGQKAVCQWKSSVPLAF